MAQLMTTTSTTRPRNIKAGTILIETDTGRLIVWDGQVWRLFAASATLDQSFQNARSVYLQGFANDGGRTTSSTLKTTANDPVMATHPAEVSISMWFCSWAFGRSVWACTTNGATILHDLGSTSYNRTYIRILPNGVYIRSSEDASGHHNLAGTFQTSTSLLDDHWHHLVITIRSELGDQNNLGHNSNDPNKLYCKMYIDGQQLLLSSGDTTLFRNMRASYSEHHVLGHMTMNNRGYILGHENPNYHGSADPFCGWVDELAWWDTELQPNEVMSIYNEGTPTDISKNNQNYTSSANLFRWYRMGDDQPVTDRQLVSGSVKDHSPHASRWDMYPSQTKTGSPAQPWSAVLSPDHSGKFPKGSHPCGPPNFPRAQYPGWGPYLGGPVFSSFAPSVSPVTRPDAMLLYHGIGVPQHNHPIHNATGDGYSDTYPQGCGADI